MQLIREKKYKIQNTKQQLKNKQIKNKNKSYNYQIKQQLKYKTRIEKKIKKFPISTASVWDPTSLPIF